ncbi:hypothetical protein BKA62DRAFT_676258 [Auriculariales sp. MPI-PUGE-AT-0066]|nr:hypothetical protein BKA62DRAFT_676258 [Auriculariales sp. MPI-PUGE-AT-0066]
MSQDTFASSGSSDVFANSDREVSPIPRRSPRGHTPASDVPATPLSMLPAKHARRKVKELEDSLAAVNERIQELVEETERLKFITMAHEQISANLSIQVAQERLHQDRMRRSFETMTLELENKLEFAVQPQITIAVPKRVPAGHTLCDRCMNKAANLSPCSCPLCLTLVQQKPIVVSQLQTIASIIAEIGSFVDFTSPEDESVLNHSQNALEDCNPDA